jgi:two-component system sensor histidine kinase UhpB
VAQESLTNVARHAHAQTVELVVEQTDGRVALTVRDDGRGISELDAAGQGIGLGGMRERALLVDGRLTVQAGASGGTEIRLEMPV